MLARRLERAVQTEFGATHVNILWGSNTPQLGHPTPHQHIHVLPRYDLSPMIWGEAFCDTTYGDLPDFHQRRVVGSQTRQVIFRRLLQLS